MFQFPFHFDNSLCIKVAHSIEQMQCIKFRQHYLLFVFPWFFFFFSFSISNTEVAHLQRKQAIIMQHLFLDELHYQQCICSSSSLKSNNAKWTFKSDEKLAYFDHDCNRFAFYFFCFYLVLNRQKKRTNLLDFKEENTWNDKDRNYWFMRLRECWIWELSRFCMFCSRVNAYKFLLFSISCLPILLSISLYGWIIVFHRNIVVSNKMIQRKFSVAKKHVCSACKQ